MNLDPMVREVLEEATWMVKLGLTVPNVIVKMRRREAQVKALSNR